MRMILVFIFVHKGLLWCLSPVLRAVPLFRKVVQNYFVIRHNGIGLFDLSVIERVRNARNNRLPGYFWFYLVESFKR